MSGLYVRFFIQLLFYSVNAQNLVFILRTDVIDVYEYTGEAEQSNFQINSADLPSNYIIPLDHINIRIDCAGLDKDTTHVNDWLNAIFSFINWSNIQNVFFGEECHSYVLSMNIEPA